MKTIENSLEYELTINKSRFICSIFPIFSKDDAIANLKITKKLYPGASHYCYAYILGSTEKASDDGEPSKTAGMPILQILRYKELTNILAVVTRYFGGIKLGTGGLSRAYSNTVSEALKLATYSEIIEYSTISFSIDYDSVNRVISYLNSYEQTSIEFAESVKLVYKIQTSKVDIVKQQLNNLTSGKISFQ